jgi:DNA-binding GntR family transcriptional regulator
MAIVGERGENPIRGPRDRDQDMADGEGKNRNAYRTIKALVTGGELRAGTRLAPEQLKEVADASLTTTYNALRCLVVERLIDGSPSEGFHMPALTDAALRGRYGWACDVAIMAVRAAAPAIAPDEPIEHTARPAHLILATETLFALIAALPEIFEYRAAMAQANDRLRPLRRYEPALLDDLGAELAELDAARRGPDPQAIIAALHRYRDRRLPLAGELMRRLGGGTGEFV